MRFTGMLFLLFSSLFADEHVYLKTPDLSSENILEIRAGVRPFRKSGVRLETELFGDKLVIHNYGYGGSGITLAFGGSRKVLEMLEEQNSPLKTVAVLGGGVAGLATAYDLLENGYTVHIYSDAWSPDLTSDVAAGAWTPPSLPADASQEQRVLNEQLLEISRKRFLKSVGAEPEFAGISLMPYYKVLANEASTESKKRYSGEDVTIHFDNGVVKEGKRREEIGIDGKLFMADLFAKVKAKGALIMPIHFDNLEELLDLEEPILINCLSLGSRALFNDLEFTPVRGQMLYLKPQEGIDYFFYQNIPDSTAYWTFVYPWSDRLILGGVYEFGEDEAVINWDAVEKILQSGRECFRGSSRE